MSRILRDFEREDESLNASHPGYYMYLSSFFMQCLRCRAQDSATNEDGTSEWGLVACAFDERALVMLNRLLRASLEGHVCWKNIAGPADSVGLAGAAIRA